MEDYYTILGLSPTSTTEEIRKKYRQLAMRYHPDHNTSDPAAEEKFKKVAEAYQILSDKSKRAEFDLSRKRFHFSKKTTVSSRGTPRQGQTHQTTPPHSTTRTPQTNWSQIFRSALENHPIRKVFTQQKNKLRKLTTLFSIKGKEWLQQRLTRLEISRKYSLLRSAKKNFRTKLYKRCKRHKEKQRNRHYQRGGLDLVYHTPLTKAELKEGKTISVRIFNNSQESDYKFLKVTIPPGSKSGQRLRIRGKGHISGLGNKKGDLYLHLEERN